MLSQEIIKEAVRLYESGMSMREVRKALGLENLPLARFYRAFEKAGVKRRPQGTVPGRKRPPCRECGRPAQARGLCMTHYMQHKRAGEF